jgi:hypothetical protein
MKRLFAQFLIAVTVVLLTGCSKPGITIKDAYWRGELASGIDNASAKTYTCDDGYSFLVVEMDIRTYLKKFSSEEVKVVCTEGNTSFPCTGIKLGGDYKMGEFGGKMKAYSGSLVFTIPENLINKSFNLMYRNIATVIPLDE